MSWTEFPGDVVKFAELLCKLTSTQPTGEGLIGAQGFLRQTWSAARKMSIPAGVPIPGPRRKGLHPRGAEIVDSNLIFNFELGQAWDADYLPHRADFQVVIRGHLLTERCIISLEDHWRVDSHIFPADPPPREPHPYFHFQRGGHAQDAFSALPGFVPVDALVEIIGQDYK